MTTRRASCSCGQLTVSCNGDPVRISVCHCLACQQRTGSAFGAQARFAREHIAVTGRSTSYKRIADSGNALTFHFCPTCGSTVYWEVGAFYAVAIGAFADPKFPPPRFSVYEARKHSWVRIPDAEQFD